jgi:hypothetical protein
VNPNIQSIWRIVCKIWTRSRSPVKVTTSPTQSNRLLMNITNKINLEITPNHPNEPNPTRNSPSTRAARWSIYQVRKPRKWSQFKFRRANKSITISANIRDIHLLLLTQKMPIEDRHSKLWVQKLNKFSSPL